MKTGTITVTTVHKSEKAKFCISHTDISSIFIALYLMVEYITYELPTESVMVGCMEQGAQLDTITRTRILAAHLRWKRVLLKLYFFHSRSL